MKWVWSVGEGEGIITEGLEIMGMGLLKARDSRFLELILMTF
jgi:hypothetical protein